MSNLPYATGLTDEFTTLIPTSVSSSEWVNQKGSTNFILQNAVFSDNTITIAGSNVAWLPITEPTEYTAYILCKTYIPSYSNDWATVFACRNSSNRCYVAMSIASNTAYKLRTYFSSTLVEPTIDEWHVIAVKRTVGHFYVYADGNLIISETNTATERGDKFMIKSYTGVGSTPTVDVAITVYLKYCAIFNIVQTDDQIKENCNQILVDFGLKIPEKDSLLAGTDAVAIAYAIARNQESAAALQHLKKAYREGLIEGDNGSGEVVEPYETDDDVIDITTGEDPTGTDPAVIDLTTTGGLWLKYQNPDDETDIRTVKIYLTDDNDADYASSGYPSSFKGSVIDHKIAADVYDKDGQLLTTNYMLTYSGNTSWYYVKKINEGTLIEKIITTKIHIHANNCTVDRDYHYENYSYQTGELSSEGEYQNIDYLGFGAYLSGYTYISCGNIKPQ